jgi:beta-lactamase regulating signal transducer with metallopeptidase domain
MSAIREVVFDLAFNALLQIGFFAIVTAIFSRLVARANAKYQYIFYIAVLVFCLATPVINTLWQSRPVTVAERSLQQVLPQRGGVNQSFWPWQSASKEHEQLKIRPEIQNWIVAIWGLFVLYQLIHFSRGVHRVHRLRREALALSPAVFGTASQIIEASHRIALLESTAIDDPVTVGVFRPVILLPSKVLPSLDEQDLSAILAHEYGHIHRRDFLTLILCELLSLPVVWHPGIRYLMSKISQTREIACDDYAAARFGKRRLYAHTLLRLASLCLHSRRGNAVALGIFDGDNLENRIMMLTKKKLSLSRAGAVGLTLALSIPFGACAVLAHAVSLQAGSVSSNTTQTFAGTWHWMFSGKSFATMVLVPNGSGFTGSVTPSRIALNDDGGLLRADPSEDSTPSPIAKAELNGSALHVTIGDGSQSFEFTVTLKDETHAEIHPVGAPPNMKPIPAEKVH